MAGLAGPKVNLAALSREQLESTAQTLGVAVDREAQSLFKRIFPDEDTRWVGPPILKNLIVPGQMLYARYRYQKHLEFFAAGAEYRERCARCGNRIGKTLAMGGYEMAAHLSGLYPEWWTGRRFDHPINAWAAGKKNETTRDIVQGTLLGGITKDHRGKVMDGRGIVPGWLLGKPSWKQGVANMVDTIPIKHVSGGESELGFKSYEQGRTSFEGTGQHVIWDDEEPPEDVYDEQLMRVLTTKGILMLTFTPLLGMTQVVLGFMPTADRPVA